MEVFFLKILDRCNKRNHLFKNNNKPLLAPVLQRTKYSSAEAVNTTVSQLFK